MKAGTTLAVLHGSNLGTCRALAKLFAEEAADFGCTTTVGSLDDFAGALPESDAIVIVASSYNGQPTYWGMFEDNDPRKRLLAIANRDNDLGEYWEFSDQGIDPVDLSNEAYKFGTNYFVYGLTH